MPTSNPKLIEREFPKALAHSAAGSPSIINMPTQTPGLEGAVTPEVRQFIDQLQRTAWEARAQLRLVEQERDALNARCEEGHRLNFELRSRLPENADGHRPAPRTPEAHSALLGLRQARDSAQATARELTNKLSQAQEDNAILRDELEAAKAAPLVAPSTPVASDPSISEAQAEMHDLEQQTVAQQITLLRAQVEEVRAEAGRETKRQLEGARLEISGLQQQREEVLMQLEIVTKEVLGLRLQLGEQVAEAERRQASLEEARRQLSEFEHSVAPLQAEQAALRASLDEAQTSLSAAQKQIERIIRDRDEIREGATKENLTLASELEQKKSQLSQWQSAAERHEKGAKEAEQLREALERADLEKGELAERFEAQRLQTIDLAARLEAERHQIRLMSSRLGEARLLAKASGIRVEEPVHVAPATPPPAPEKQEAAAFDTALALESIRAMRRCYHSFAKAPEELSHLSELHTQIHLLAEHATETHFGALNRLVAAFDTFVQELYHFPEQITPTSLQTIPQTIEFLASLMKMRDLRDLKDASTATVFVVEDDELTGECITMAMETSMMRGISLQDPAKAALELARTPCDLIFLDINMPGMDGFELCSEIRQFAMHRDTPIVFLSGMATPELRLQAERVGGTDFLAKPFILCELTLKALVHISKAHLHMV